jgi:hypothetical protein
MRCPADRMPLLGRLVGRWRSPGCLVLEALDKRPMLYSASALTGLVAYLTHVAAGMWITVVDPCPIPPEARREQGGDHPPGLGNCKAIRGPPITGSGRRS